MTKPKWIAFDMYTTLMNREAGGVPALRAVLQRLGAQAVDAETMFNDWHHAVIRAYRTKFTTWKEAGRRVMPEIGRRHGVTLGPEAAEAIYASMPDWPPHRDVAPVLSKLRGQGYKLAVVTNMDTDLFESTRLGVPLDAAVTSEMAGAYKPSPVIFDYALREFGCRRDELLWAGTAVWADVMGAKLADLTVVWVRRAMGFSVGAMELAPWDPVPDYQIDSLEGLPAIIERL